MEYVTTVKAVQKPELYDGENCDEHHAKWDAYFEGDMDSEHTSEELSFNPKDYPAGTKLIVMEPECPICDQAASYCMEVAECGFDWKQWTENEFS